MNVYGSNLSMVECQPINYVNVKLNLLLIMFLQSEVLDIIIVIMRFYLGWHLPNLRSHTLVQGAYGMVST